MADVRVDIRGLHKAMDNLGSLMGLMNNPRLLRKTADTLKEILVGRIENKGNYVVDKAFAPNAPATVWRKGMNHPYTDTELLLKQMVSKKTSTGYFVGVEGSRAFVAAILEFGAQIQVTPRMRAWWIVNFPFPLSRSTTRIIIPPRFLFLHTAQSRAVKDKLLRELSMYIMRRVRW